MRYAIVTARLLLGLIFLAPDGLLLAIVVSILALFLLWAHRDRFAPLVRA